MTEHDDYAALIARLKSLADARHGQSRVNDADMFRRAADALEAVIRERDTALSALRETPGAAADADAKVLADATAMVEDFTAVQSASPGLHVDFDYDYAEAIATIDALAHRLRCRSSGPLPEAVREALEESATADEHNGRHYQDEKSLKRAAAIRDFLAGRASTKSGAVPTTDEEALVQVALAAFFEESTAARNRSELDPARSGIRAALRAAGRACATPGTIPYRIDETGRDHFGIGWGWFVIHNACDGDDHSRCAAVDMPCEVGRAFAAASATPEARGIAERVESVIQKIENSRPTATTEFIRRLREAISDNGATAAPSPVARGERDEEADAAIIKVVWDIVVIPNGLDADGVRFSYDGRRLCDELRRIIATREPEADEGAARAVVSEPSALTADDSDETCAALLDECANMLGAPETEYARVIIADAARRLRARSASIEVTGDTEALIAEGRKRVTLLRENTYDVTASLMERLCDALAVRS